MNSLYAPIVIILLMVVFIFIIYQFYSALADAYDKKVNELTEEIRMHANTDRALQKACEQILELEEQLNKLNR